MSEPLDVDAIRAELLAFYDARRRDLPWRRDTDPYRVWVSEIMLQQTRVETAVPYFERWIERFPTLDALAEAPLDDVLRAWAGLGYYRRARNLHHAARIVRERHDGEIPADTDELRRLPGIGDYTAGAIASIAFGLPEPAVDGNVRRVLSRLHDLPDPGAAELRRLATALVPADRPGDFNQALMELGATVCTPRSPLCDACPIAALCRARAAGTQLERPLPKPSKRIPEDDVGTAVLVAPDGALLLVRRPDEGLLAGLWEFPGAVVEPGETPEDAARRAAAAALGAPADAPARTTPGPATPGRTPDDATGASPSVPADPADPAGTAAAANVGAAAPVGTVVHTFTHRRIAYHAFRFMVAAAGRRHGGLGRATASDEADADGAAMIRERGAGGGADGRAWVPPDEVDGYAISAAQRRILALLRSG